MLYQCQLVLALIKNKRGGKKKKNHLLSRKLEELVDFKAIDHIKGEGACKYNKINDSDPILT
jgi:hypothetical protein